MELTIEFNCAEISFDLVNVSDTCNCIYKKHVVPGGSNFWVNTFQWKT